MVKPHFRSNDVCFLLGAGASRHADVPTMPEMWEHLFDTWPLSDFYKRIDELRSRDDRNIEALLKYLHDSASDRSAPFGVGNSDTTLAKALLTRSDKIIEFEIRKFILHQVDHHVYRREYDALNEWIPIDGPLDIFSLNYDLVIEDFCNRNRMPLHDGFDANGNWAPISWPLATKGIRLWKLHGSINWKVDRKTGLLTKIYAPRTLASVLHASHSASLTAEVELIWPAVYKEFEGSLAVMQHAFLENVRHSSVLAVFGYRFADPSILSAMRAAFASNPSLRIFIACGSSGDKVKARIASEIAPELANQTTLCNAKGEDSLKFWARPISPRRSAQHLWREASRQRRSPCNRKTCMN
jgi:hypothetical protein